MARRIPILKCLAFIAITYSFTLTFLFMSTNPACPSCSQPVENGQPNQREGTHTDHIKNSDHAKGDNQDNNVFNLKGDNLTLAHKGDNPEWGPHKLAVIVPYRDRFEELLEFAPHLHEFLVKKKVRHHIYVVNQVDSYRFNRGSLINVGVLESEVNCDYIAMHDVDLLPLNDKLDYSYPRSGPFHVAAPEIHPLYHYQSFIGGILLITKRDFALVNGLSTRYYGWGREDDEFYVRLKQAGLLKTSSVVNNGKEETKYEIRRPQNISTGLNTFRHIHEKQKRPRDNARYFGQKEKTSKLDRETGVMTVKYDVVKTHHLIINGAPVIMLDVKLSCDFIKTPWCLRKEDHYLLNDIAAFPPKPDMRSP